MIGILVTVAVQSSSTSTSIIVALVSAGAPVKNAIPMIFGSNVGTSVTNTIVSMTQAGDREAFRRAFAAATVHDMFNWLSVIVLTVIELATGFLEKTTQVMVDSMDFDEANNGTMQTNGSSGGGGPDLLKPLTKPLTNLVVQVDKKVLLGWSFQVRFLKLYFVPNYSTWKKTYFLSTKNHFTDFLFLQDPAYANVTSILKKVDPNEGSTYLLALLGQEGLGWDDVVLGIILLAFSLALLCGCLIALMKILNSMLGTQMAILIQKTINAQIPYVPWLTGYFAMLLGCVITILVRSSSVFTSTLTPLCGTGLVTLETAYPMTLGSNIGTTTTSILASFAAEGRYLKPSIQISFVHLLFNISGILLFYPIPIMRWPITLAQILGDVTANYRWFAGLYLIAMFVVAPLFVFILSLAGTTVMYSVVGPFLVLIAVIALINVIQAQRSHWLPHVLRDWTFLPLALRSLKPLDDFFRSLPCCSKCTIQLEPEHQDVEAAIVKATMEGVHSEEMQVLVGAKKPAMISLRQEA